MAGIPALSMLNMLSSILAGGGKVSGYVKYSDGSKCSHCRVSAMTSSGVTDPTYTDGSGYYSLKLANPYLQKIYVSGNTVWSGSRNCSSGCKINVTKK